MKLKSLLIVMLSTIMPLNVFAYSDYIIPGGESIGIDIKLDGVMVVGFYKINGEFNKGNPIINIGDRIVKVGADKVNTIEELTSSIEKNINDNTCKITLIRDNKTIESDLTLKNDNGNYKTGLYVKDSISGIGTLSYIDGDTLIYGALGHEITESNTNQIIDVWDGEIFKSEVTSIDRSVRGTPGGKNASFYKDENYGDIKKNTIKGIYGNYKALPTKKALKVGKLEEVKTGSAKIYTVIDGSDIKEFEINITKVDKNNDIKNIYFEVTDPELLEKTGGIVQGMSGSPIIQDDKIIGAITHVVVSNPKTGYGIGIVRMLEEGEK